MREGERNRGSEAEMHVSLAAAPCVRARLGKKSAAGKKPASLLPSSDEEVPAGGKGGRYSGGKRG